MNARNSSGRSQVAQPVRESSATRQAMEIPSSSLPRSFRLQSPADTVKIVSGAKEGGNSQESCQPRGEWASALRRAGPPMATPATAAPAMPPDGAPSCI